MRLITFVISHSMRRLFGIGFSRLFGIGRRCIDAAKVELGSDPSNTCIRFCSRHLQVLPIHACSQQGWMHFWFDCLRLFFNACIKQKTNKTQNLNVGIAASIYPQLLTKKQQLSRSGKCKIQGCYPGQGAGGRWREGQMHIVVSEINEYKYEILTSTTINK